MEYKTLLKDGKNIQICLREFREEDAASVVACIRDEYGSTYLRYNFYDPATIIR